MEKRRLGQTDLMVSPLCLGGNVFGWTADEATSFKILDGFVDAGLNFIDTADVYSAWVPDHTGGESESIIGRWMKARGTRDRVVVATKVGWERGLSAAHIRTAVEDSLKRLQTECIDLYQSHKDDPNTDEWRRAVRQHLLEHQPQRSGTADLGGRHIVLGSATPRS